MPPSPLELVHVASGDLWAGAEVQLYYLARALQSRSELHLHVVLLNHGELEQRLRSAGVSVEVLDERRWGPARLVLRLRRLLRESGARVVHSHRYKENLLSAAAARGTSCIAVRSIHSLPEPPQGLRARAVRRADALAARWQQLGVCVSPELPARVRELFPHLPLEVIENGIDYQQLAAAARAPVDESQLGAGFRVGFVARLVAIKRPDILVATAHRLARDRPGQFSFHLFGDGPMAPPCREFVARHGLEQQVRLFGFQSDMAAWLSRCDALLLCSDHEGLPMVVLEAMGLGVPVVAHAVGGIPHALDSGRYGTLVREQTPAAYATALCQLADERALARERTELARHHALTHYGIEAVIDRYLTLYRRLLGESRPASVITPEAAR